MTDLSRLADMAEILGAAIVVGGVFFAVLQMRQIRQQRRELAAIELFRSFGNPRFANAYQTVLNLPDGLTDAEIGSEYADAKKEIMLICTTMENIGVMTFQRIVPFLVVNNLVGTTAIVLWKKVENWVGDLRVTLDEPATFEWFQWLAEKLEECRMDDQAPAYQAFSDWTPTRLTSEL